MAKKLSDVAVKTLAPRRVAYIVWDSHTTGLGIKVTPSQQAGFGSPNSSTPATRFKPRRTLGLLSQAMGLR